MNPIFIVLTPAGEVFVCPDLPSAKSIAAGSIVKVSGLPSKRKLATLSGSSAPYTITPGDGIVSGGHFENR